ncbi:heavy-metal-associated domain-containing protein [Candidatus Bathyarchaeota archaeon]|nr:heavy-metal-associated domain-containing protein [Candidatus Bathyarchaeota archaeon]
MAEHKYDFEITMTCGGCSGAVDRVLKKLEGEFSPYFPFSVSRSQSTPPRPLDPSFVIAGSRIFRPRHDAPNDATDSTPTAIKPKKEREKKRERRRGKDKKANEIHPGVKHYEVSLADQTASVTAEPTLEYATVLRTISKTGKKINKGSADGVEQSVEVPAA